MNQLRGLAARVNRARVAALRGRRLIATACVLSVCALSLGFSTSALATTEVYASGTGVNPGEQIYDTNSHYLTLSYAHNLYGELSCAGAHNYAGFECTGAESTHPYEGTHNLGAALENPNGLWATFNGHADF